MSVPKEQPGVPLRLPTGGEVVGWLASALRFADLRAGTAEFSESTAKRVARAAAEVSDEKRSELLRALVNRFFSKDYLVSRGLEADAAREHNTLVLAGVEGALSTWDAFVGIRNGIGREYAEQVDSLKTAGVCLDITLRIGAYLAGFRNVIPASRFAWQWCSKPGIQMAFQLLLERSIRKPSDSEFIQSCRIARNTLRAIKSGESIPQEETVLRLAKAFTEYGVETSDGELADRVGLEIELRLACLVASIQTLLDPSSRTTMGIFMGPRNIAFFASDLRRYDAPTLAAIITQGVRSPRWTEIHARMKTQVLEPFIFSTVAQVQAHVDHVYQEASRLLSVGEEAAAYKLIADDCQAQARLLRESMRHIPGWEKGSAGEIHRFFEDTSSFWECLSTGKEPPLSSRSLDTWKAKGLCDQVIAPWLNQSHEEKTRLMEEAVETDPACAHVRLRAGLFFHDDPERLDDAIRHLRVAVMLDPEEQMAASLLALCLLRKNQLPEALEVIEAAATRADATLMTMQIRGALLLQAGRSREADEWFVSVLERDPNNPSALHGRADVCHERGDRVGEARFRRLADLHGGSRPIQAFPKVG